MTTKKRAPKWGGIIADDDTPTEPTATPRPARKRATPKPKTAPKPEPENEEPPVTEPDETPAPAALADEPRKSAVAHLRPLTQARSARATGTFKLSDEARELVEWARYEDKIRGSRKLTKDDLVSIAIIRVFGPLKKKANAEDHERAQAREEN